MITELKTGINGLRFDQPPFDKIDAKLRDLLINDPTNPMAVDYILENSPVVGQIIAKLPADYDLLEVAYFHRSFEKGPMKGPIDYWIHDSLSGQALRDRLNMVSGWMAKFLTDRITDDYRIIDFGAGPAAYAVETLKKMNNRRNGLNWNCIDLDRVSLHLGRKRVSENEMGNVVNFQHGNFMSQLSYPKNEGLLADFGLMIGILCGMTVEEGAGCLKRVAGHMKKGSTFVAATLLIKIAEEDPEIFQVLTQVLGWPLRPKTLDQVKELFDKAGYKINDILSEREDGHGQYAVVIATTP